MTLREAGRARVGRLGQLTRSSRSHRCACPPTRIGSHRSSERCACLGSELALRAWGSTAGSLALFRCWCQHSLIHDADHSELCFSCLVQTWCAASRRLMKCPGTLLTQNPALARAPALREAPLLGNTRLLQSPRGESTAAAHDLTGSDHSFSLHGQEEKVLTGRLSSASWRL